MAYDKNSFLAGLAAGRNMRSWPKMDFGESSSLCFTVLIDPGLTSMQYEFQTHLNGIIDWGDGTIDQKQQRRMLYSRHTYTEPGLYQIKVTGTLLAVSWGYTKWYPTDPPIGDCLISVDTPIPAIPDELLPLEIDYAYETSQGMFHGCRNLLSIHPDLLQAYAKPGITVFPQAGMFRDCENLPAIPRDLLKGIYFRGYQPGSEPFWPSLLPGMFWGCTSLRTLPDGYLDNPSLYDEVSAQSMFDGCKSLKNFPDDLFANFPDLESFYATFRNCESITKRVPELWNLFPNARFYSYCFEGCENAANYAEIPIEWIEQVD